MYIFRYIVILTDTFVLQNCTVTSPTSGIIRVACDSSYQIAVTVTCTNCNNSLVTGSGNSPLIVGGLDPGIMYSVMIKVFDGNQSVLTDHMITTTIKVMDGEAGTYIASVS